MRRAAIVLCALAGLMAASARAQAATAVPGRLIVGFREGVSSSLQKRLVEGAGGAVRAQLPHVRAAAIRARSHVALGVLERRLRARREVSYVEPDFYLAVSRVPDDPLFANEYSLGAVGPGSVDAQPAWDSRTSCSKIAILDTGVQYNHPDLSANVWHNSHEVKSNGKDDDENGWVDDYYGVNLVNGKGSGVDDDGHGTHVSGIVAGRGDNGTGIAGLCWSSSVMAVKFMDSSGKGSTSDAIDGIDYAIHEGARIVNCSFGSSKKSSALQDEVDYAKSKNVLLVVAAGNDGDNIDAKPVYPASFPEGNVLTVAATTSTGALASFSNFGKSGVDLGAPGDRIFSTYLTSTYKTLSGTSMAAPLVAAAAAMLRAKDSSLGYADIKNALRNHTRADAALAGKTVSGGTLDVSAALAAVH
ncbi:MAG: peptidase and in kexin sedolisin [Solirubrobacterales bacterium]|jgi:thermitase|nr:peptidase and in kexin sedolisin [Solirubrobacterales bacterium]